MTDASSQPCEGRKIQELNQMDSSCCVQTGNWFGCKCNTYFGGVFTREQITTGTRVTVLFKACGFVEEYAKVDRNRVSDGG